MANAHANGLPGLDALQRATANGDIDGIRRAVLDLDAREQRVLEARLGPDEVQRIVRRVRRPRRGSPLGRVVVVHGIMGSRLEAVEPGGDTDRIWVNYFRLALGRIRELKLQLDGSPAKPEYRIRVAGLFPEYLSLITELAERWQVLPFAFDWRKDIDESADQLAARVRQWSVGEPVHVVAHSMGGLVARRLAQRSAGLWTAMADGTKLARGGRVVMLGTPNRGSYAIPLVLTGEEKTVRLLENLDLRHDRRQLLDIIGTFLGSYQMLPSPLGNVPDDRAKLYQPETWGAAHVSSDYLARARAFHEALDVVTSPERLVYVAGFDQPTPFRIRVEGPGRFRYQETLDGDGRVPHELGVLDQVPTFWVREVHGDLPRNADVLAGIHDLLERGTTDVLLRERPVRRATASPEWRDPAAIEDIEKLTAMVGPELLPGARRGPKGRAPKAIEAEVRRVAQEDAARVESLLVRDYLGTPGGGAAERSRDQAGEGAAPEGPRRRRAAPKLRIQVRWDDVKRVDADVYAVGHYQGVLPQRAERALDEAISGAGAGEQDLVLTRLTRRGMLRGGFGDVAFFPMANGGRKGRVVAVAGMGHPGGFGAPELRRLARNLASSILALPAIRRVCSVLIGGGTGNLAVPVATENLVLGIADAVEATTNRSEIRELLLVEYRLDKAYEIQAALEGLRGHPELRSRIELDIAPIDVPKDGGGTLGDSYCFGLALASAAAAADGDGRARRALDTLLGGIKEVKGFREPTLKALRGIKVGDGVPLAKVAAAISVSLRDPDGSATAGDGGAPTRLSFVQDANGIVAAALTDTVVRPERRLGADPRLLDELVLQMVEPESRRVRELSQLLAQLVVPRDFRELISRTRPTIFEVDRRMASVHWEMLASRLDGEAGDGEVLSLVTPVARQLRTAYSPPPSAAPPARWPLRALVIGDPGDPKDGDSLPGARDEAFAVVDLLRAKGLSVEALIGAPGAARTGRLASVEPASRLAVLSKLMNGGYDLLHYAGHAGFDEGDMSTAGWLFEGGLLTSRELEHVDLAPRLVVANACLSARTSNVYRSGARSAKDAKAADGAKAPNEADLLPGLADEFFRRGVRNYIGTAWEVNDVGAVQFATELYESLFPAPGRRVTLGEALKKARLVLKGEERRFGTLWAAYQHYGDPLATVVGEPEPRAEGGAAGDASAGRAAGASRRAARPASARTR